MLPNISFKKGIRKLFGNPLKFTAPQFKHKDVFSKGLILTCTREASVTLAELPQH